MALLNRVWFSTSTADDGPVTIGAAVSDAFVTPADAGAINGVEYTWIIEDGEDFEFVKGAYSSSGPSFDRTEVLISKIGGTVGTSKISLSGSATVRIDASAQDLILSTALAAGVNFVNGTLAASVGSNALTIAVKTLAGTDPSASNPIYAVFRNATAATGNYVVRKLTAATSLVISSGSTMGASNGVPFRLWIVGFDDGGTFRLGAVNCRGSSGVMSLGANDVRSSTAEGGAGAADSAQTIYTGTAVTSKAMVVLGYMDWSSGLTTAGTWDATPSAIQLFGPGVPLPGQIVQAAFATSAGSSTTSTSMVDVTSGSVSITPRSEANAVDVIFSWTATTQNVGGVNNSSYNQVLRGATNISGSDSHRTSAFSGAGGIGAAAGQAFAYLDFPGSTSSVTYKLQHRTFNGGGASTVNSLTMRIAEIMG